MSEDKPQDTVVSGRTPAWFVPPYLHIPSFVHQVTFKTIEDDLTTMRSSIGQLYTNVNALTTHVNNEFLLMANNAPDEPESLQRIRRLEVQVHLLTELLTETLSTTPPSADKIELLDQIRKMVAPLEVRDEPVQPGSDDISNIAAKLRPSVTFTESGPLRSV